MENRRRSSFRQLKSLDRKRVTLARNARVPSRLVRVPEVDGRKRMEEPRKNRIGRIILENRARSVYIRKTARCNFAECREKIARIVSILDEVARPSFPRGRGTSWCARVVPGITRRSAARTYHHIAPVANVVGRGGKERRTRMCTRDLWYYQVKYTRRTLAGKMVSKKSRNLLRSSSSHDIVPLVSPPPPPPTR